MANPPEWLTPGQRVAWHRVRRGMPQPVLAGLVGRTEDWLSKIENDRAPLDRLSVIKALADALHVTVFDLIGEPVPRTARDGPPGLPQLRAALLDYRQLSPLFAAINAEDDPPRLDHMRQDVGEVMDAYQRSRYGFVLRRVPDLLVRAHLATRAHDGDDRLTAFRLAALASQSAAMILTKLGEPDLAWIAAQRGLSAAERSGDVRVIGSLMRSLIHALHTHGRPLDATAMTRTAADLLHRALDASDPVSLSVYGTLLLPGAVAAARAGDRATAREYLDEAGATASRLQRDSNWLWTAFGPTNVKIHRVTAAMALGDVQAAHGVLPVRNKIDQSKP